MLVAIASARHFFISGSVENVQLMGSDKHNILVWCSRSREALIGAKSHTYCGLLLFLLFLAFLPMIYNFCNKWRNDHMYFLIPAYS